MKKATNLFDPSRNPAVLDTATWDRAAARRAVSKAGARWAAACEGGTVGNGVTAYCGSVVRRGAATFLLAGLPDGQQVFVELGRGGAVLGEPLGEMTLKNGLRVAAYPTDAAVVDRYCRVLRPHNRPRAMGATPRLGIGCRMTTSVWPGMFEAMRRGNFAANTIQNSVRELNFLDDLLAARPAPTNYACGFGMIETGYTGSTWEGLWVSGVLAALQNHAPVQYGADDDWWSGWEHHSYRIDQCFCDQQHCAAVQCHLLRGESGHRQSGQEHGCTVGAAEHPGQCHCAGLYSYRSDRCHGCHSGGAETQYREHADEAVRADRRVERRHCVPGVGRVVVHDRGLIVNRRRVHGVVSNDV